MSTSEPIISFEPIPLGSKLKLKKYEQYDLLNDEFTQSMFRMRLFPSNVLKQFFGVERTPFTGDYAVMPIASHPLPIQKFFLLIIDHSYLLVGIEIYTLNEIDYQSRFLVEVGYSVTGLMSETGQRHYEILNSICDLENFIRKFKKWSDMPFFVWEMS